MDGSDTGLWLTRLFQVLNRPEAARMATVDEDLARFPYINGDLFRDPLSIPDFDSLMREALIAACRFDWSKVSPAIFGSLFQSVMEPAQRRAEGAHYTTERNILKVIEPLFLDGLRAEFEQILALRRGRRARLEAFHQRLGEMTFFDPACGCGNFLIIAYRELRRLEIEVIRELRAYEVAEEQRQLDVAALSRIDVDQFYGIELSEFPARIAETALWMMDHIMNNELSLAFGQSYARIPLKAVAAHPARGRARNGLGRAPSAPERCSYVFGNPPFGGAKFQSPEQREQVRRIANARARPGARSTTSRRGSSRRASTPSAATPPSASWRQTRSRKASRWGSSGQSCSDAAGWRSRSPTARSRGARTRGARRTCTSSSSDSRKGMMRRAKGACIRMTTSTENPTRAITTALSPYLFDGGGLADPHVVVREAAQPINGLPKLIIRLPSY